MDNNTKLDLALSPGFLTEKDGSRRFTGFDLVDRLTGTTVGTVYPDKAIDHLKVASEFSGASELAQGVQDAIEVIEHLHRKFGETGSGVAVLERLRASLAKVDNPTLIFEGDGDESEITLEEFKEVISAPIYGAGA